MMAIPHIKITRLNHSLLSLNSDHNAITTSAIPTANAKMSVHIEAEKLQLLSLGIDLDIIK
tara:strand:+ start:996 stop:1178 length:183 start_codon:yes stop_codon:yes gene_type:complete